MKKLRIIAIRVGEYLITAFLLFMLAVWILGARLQEAAMSANEGVIQSNLEEIERLREELAKP